MFLIYFFFFFKQKTAYEMRISDWSSDVCSSDLGQDGDLGVDVDAGGVAGLVRAILRHAHVADAYADDPAAVVVQRFCGGEAGIDLDAQGFGLRRQPRAHRAEADDEVALVVHTRRHDRRLVAAGFREEPELVAGDRKSTRLNSSHQCASRMPSSD